MAGEAVPSGGFRPVFAGCGGVTHRGGVTEAVINRLPEIGGLFPIFVFLTDEGLGLDNAFVISGGFEGIARPSILTRFL